MPGGRADASCGGRLEEQPCALVRRRALAALRLHEAHHAAGTKPKVFEPPPPPPDPVVSLRIARRPRPGRLWNRLWKRSVTTLETAKKRCDAAASGLGNVKKRCIRPQILFS